MRQTRPAAPVANDSGIYLAVILFGIVVVVVGLAMTGAH
jgi:hypothetical protein